MLGAFVYKMTKYAELKTEHIELLKNCDRPVKFWTKCNTKNGCNITKTSGGIVKIFCLNLKLFFTWYSNIGEVEYVF